MESETGKAFVAIAELLNIGSDELLEALMGSYVSSVRENIIDVAHQNPGFSDRYPFIEHHIERAEE